MRPYLIQPIGSITKSRIAVANMSSDTESSEAEDAPTVHHDHRRRQRPYGGAAPLTGPTSLGAESSRRENAPATPTAVSKPQPPRSDTTVPATQTPRLDTTAGIKSAPIVSLAAPTDAAAKPTNDNSAVPRYNLRSRPHQ